MNVCKRILSVLLSVFIVFATLPVSSVVFAEQVSTPKIFEDNFDDESSLENYEAAVNNAYYGTTLNSKDVAPTIETLDGKSVFKARKGSSSNQYAAELIKDMPQDRRVESITTTFKQTVEPKNEDALSSIVAFHINSRNSLILCVYPSSADEYLYYSWCRFTYSPTGAASTANNTYEVYKDQLSGAARRRVKTNLIGDNTDWLTVTLNYDYSQINDNILTVSATLKDAEGNEGIIDSFSAKFDDIVYDCTDAEGNILESGQYMKYDENFKVGISSYTGNYLCYYDNFTVRYGMNPKEFAEDFRTKYSEELAYSKITTSEQFDSVAKAKHDYDNARDSEKALLANEKDKLSAVLKTYKIAGDDFEYENLFNEIWETIPYSGDILTWDATNSVFNPTTESTRTEAAAIIQDSKDSTNHVFAPEIRSQQRKVKMQTLKEDYLKKGAMVESFAVDFRLDKNYVWDANSGIYYYYRDPHNWGRIEISLASSGLVTARLLQNKGSNEEDIVSTWLLSGVNLSNTATGMWINVKVDYEYLNDGTNLTFTFSDKATQTAIITKTYKTTDFNEGGKVGLSSRSSANNEIYYDNFTISFTESADDFREEYADVLGLQAITTKAQYEEVVETKLALESLALRLQNKLTEESAHLTEMMETYLASYKISTDDFEYPNFTKSTWEMLPETGDIMTWDSKNSVFYTGESSSGADESIIEAPDDATNHVLKVHRRNVSRKRKILTLKENFLREDAVLKSFSTDVRMDVSAGWDANSGLYYYYKNPYNWGRIELILSTTGDLNLTARIMEQAGTDDGTEMVAETKASNTAFTGVVAGDWATIKVNYTFTEEGTTAIAVNLINKETGEIITTRNFTSTNVVGDFKIGYGSTSSTSEVTYYDNFALEYTKTAEEFKADHERVLALDLSTVTVEDIADINAAISDYEALHYSVKPQTSGEYALLNALKAKIIRMQKLNTVYISSTGDDNGNGTSSNPVATFDAAVALMNKGGSICIDGEYVVDSKFTFKSYSKDLVITGGTLDLSALKNVNFANNITFDDVTLKFQDKGNVYANGYNLIINSNVTVVGTTYLYGGGAAGTTVDSTNLKILSGNYMRIYGGSNQGTILGDANLYVGGTVNNGVVTPLAHESTYRIYGGGNGDAIKGNVNTTFADNAVTDYIFGGSSGANSSISGISKLKVLGNTCAFSVSGGSDASGAVGGIHLIIDGGEMIQVLAACQSAMVEADVNVELLSGKISRRFYGGVYSGNPTVQYIFGTIPTGIEWTYDYRVKGTITVLLSSDMEITYDAYDTKENESFDDLSFYVHSRNQNYSDEKAVLVYKDSAAYNKFNGKLCAQDSKMSIIMDTLSGVRTASDDIYTASYSKNDNTITQKFTLNSGSTTRSAGTATVSIDEKNWEYTGNAIEPATIVYNSTWVGTMDISYSNNIEVGTATATISTNGVSASTTFDIYYDTTPTLLGASIKKGATTQDIQFTSQLPKSSKKVCEYGMAVTFYNNIGNGVELSDMTANTTNEAVTVAKRILSVPVIMSQETFTLNIGKIDADKYGYRYVVRAFVRYEGDSTYYYSDDNTGILSSTSGVENGYASRSVISISKSILSWVYENQDVLHNEYGVADVNAIIKKNETTGKYSWVSGITANNGEKVLAYLNNNAEAISEAIKDLS